MKNYIIFFVLKVFYMTIEFESIPLLVEGLRLSNKLNISSFFVRVVYQETFFSIFWIYPSRNNSYHPSDQTDGERIYPIHFLSLFRLHIRFDFIKLLCYSSSLDCAIHRFSTKWFAPISTVCPPVHMKQYIIWNRHHRPISFGFICGVQKIPYTCVLFTGSYFLSRSFLSYTSPAY